jgi:hypothetical protein
MTVLAPVVAGPDEEETENGGMDDVIEGRTRQEEESVKMRNHWVTTVLGVLIWIVIMIMNIANLVLLGLGNRA